MDLGAVGFVGFLVALFGGMILLCYLGQHLGRRHRTRGGSTEGLGSIDGSVFALLGLLIAFTFSGAADRFDRRRRLIVEEANALSTAYLRLDVLPAEARDRLRGLMRAYLDARLATYDAIPNFAEVSRQLERATVLRDQIWGEATQAVSASTAPGAPILVLPALNAVFDVATTRMVATTIHPPRTIYLMLALMALASALLAGFGMAGDRVVSPMHVVGFAAVITLTVFIIIDLEYPRRGLLRVDATDQVLRDVRSEMR